MCWHSQFQWLTDNSKKLDKEFIITKNSVDLLPVCPLMEKVNTKCVVLNIYFMVGMDTISSGDVFSYYCECCKKLLRYLNVVLVLEAFEHTFYTCRPGVDCNKKSLNILNVKWSCFCIFLEYATWKKFAIRLDFSVSKKKKRAHMSLKNPFVCYEFFNKFLNFVEIEWEKKNEIIYPPSIPSFKWHYDYLFFEKKNKTWKTKY